MWFAGVLGLGPINGLPSYCRGNLSELLRRQESLALAALAPGHVGLPSGFPDEANRERPLTIGELARNADVVGEVSRGVQSPSLRREIAASRSSAISLSGVVRQYSSFV